MTATLQEAEKLRQRLAALTTTELRQLIGSYSAIVGLQALQKGKCRD